MGREDGDVSRLRLSYAFDRRFVGSDVRLLIIVVALLAAACEPALPPGSELVPGSPLLVQVTRYGSIDDRSAVQGRVTVTSREEVNRLQQDANGLPPFPQQTMFCPYDDGSHYAVRFIYADGLALTVFAEIRGCQGVGPTYDGRWVRWSATDHAFLDDLETIEGAPTAGTPSPLSD